MDREQNRGSRTQNIEWSNEDKGEAGDGDEEHWKGKVVGGESIGLMHLGSGKTSKRISTKSKGQQSMQYLLWASGCMWGPPALILGDRREREKHTCKSEVKRQGVSGGELKRQEVELRQHSIWYLVPWNSIWSDAGLWANMSESCTYSFTV